MTREIKWMLGVWGLFLAASLLVFQVSCTTKSSPTGPVAGAVTFTWAAPFVLEVNGFPFAEVNLEVNGSPYTGAAVSLSALGGGSVPLTYDSRVSLKGRAYSDYDTDNFTYSPGDTYVLSSNVLGTVASVTLVAPGPVAWQTATTGGAITLVTATTQGNFSFLAIQNSNGDAYTLERKNFSFPVTIHPPISATYPAGVSFFSMDVGAGDTVSSISNATLPYGAVSIYQEKEAGVSIP